MKKILFLFSFLALILTGCTGSSPEDIVFDEWQISGGYPSGRVTRIGDVVLYDCGSTNSVFIKKSEADAPQRIKEMDDFDVFKISSSDAYFYISGRVVTDNDVWSENTNVLVMDTSGEIIAAKECSCGWIYVCGDTVLGYYDDEENEGDGWDGMRIEATHYIDEKTLLETEEDDISKWTPITGNQITINGKTLYRQKGDNLITNIPDGLPYYTDTVYYDAYTVLDFICYVDGKKASEMDKKKAKKYLKQLWDIMGGKEKNIELYSYQTGSNLFGVCNVYSKSGGFLQHFTKDIEYSWSFHYDSNKDAIIMEEKFDGKELSYWNGEWIVYRIDSEIFVENLQTKQVEKIFENDSGVGIEITNDIVTVWDSEMGDNGMPEAKKSNAFILK